MNLEILHFVQNDRKEIMDEVLAFILKDTFTLISLKHRVRILKSYLDEKLFGKTEKELLESSDRDWLNSLPSQLLEKFNKDNLLSQTSELENKLKELKVLTLYLAFEVTDQAAYSLGARARALFNPTLLLDIKFNPSLVAGCALVWKGIYKDYSLRSRIDQNHEQILSSLKSFSA